VAQILKDYLASVAGQAFSYMTSDCAAFVVGWADAATGKTSLPTWNGFYSDEQSCRDFVKSHGGFEMIADSFLKTHHGITQSSEKATGNIVLVEFRSVETMGIRVGDDRVALRSVGVYVTCKARVKTEWGVPWRW
jgi:hypothetical protein